MAVCEWVGSICDESVKIIQSSKTGAVYQDLMEQSQTRKVNVKKY